MLLFSTDTVCKILDGLNWLYSFLYSFNIFFSLFLFGFFLYEWDSFYMRTGLLMTKTWS